MRKNSRENIINDAKSLKIIEEGIPGIIGDSPQMKQIFRLIGKVAPSDSTVLITGESGTGKELIAKSIHCLSKRNEGPFIPLNCSAIPDELLESELFGHEKGAFTGAYRDRPGRFELAAKGSIFLDEISELNPGLQSKILRVIQEKELERVGGTSTLKADVRIIAATNRNLEEDVKSGRFREDLFYRLNVIPVRLPALRQRKDDIVALLSGFLERERLRKKTDVKGFSADVMNILKEYPWPGNVRELENFVERMTLLCEKEIIEREDLPEKFFIDDLMPGTEKGITVLPEEGIDLNDLLKGVEKALLMQALARSGWIKNRAAGLLGLNRTTLVEKLKKYRIDGNPRSK